MNVLDRAIGVVSPAWALRRQQARLQLRTFESGKLHSHLQGWNPLSQSGNSAPIAEVQRTRYRSWDQYRNNSNVRKVVNAFCARIIGKGLLPDPMAVREVSRGLVPFPEFNRRTKELWRIMMPRISGQRPGRGGHHFIQQQWQAIKSICLAGEILSQIKPIDRRRAISRNMAAPIQVQLIHPERLAETMTAFESRVQQGNKLFRGIELSPTDERVAYWLYDSHPAEPFNLQTASVRVFQTPKRVPVDQIIHTYVPDDIDGLRGVSWLAAALIKFRDVDDLNENELMSSAAAACVAMALEGDNPGGSFGLSSPDAVFGGNNMDADNNRVSYMQPKLFLDLRGLGAKLVGFNPNRPNTNVVEFGNAIKSSAGRSLPGIKSSISTGDYKEATFASEQAEENDSWREVEQVQNWFNWNFNEPIYEQVIRLAVLNGFYDSVAGFLADEFAEFPDRFMQANWHGPVMRSINRKDDEAATALALKNGTSSLQQEAAHKGTNWMENIENMSEVFEFANQFGPEVVDVVKSYYSQSGSADSRNPDETGTPQLKVAQ